MAGAGGNRARQAMGIGSKQTKHAAQHPTQQTLRRPHPRASCAQKCPWSRWPPVIFCAALKASRKQATTCWLWARLSALTPQHQEMRKACSRQKTRFCACNMAVMARLSCSTMSRNKVARAKPKTQILPAAHATRTKSRNPRPQNKKPQGSTCQTILFTTPPTVAKNAAFALHFARAM